MEKKYEHSNGLKTVQLHINKAVAKSEIKRQCLLLWAITSLNVIQAMFHICSARIFLAKAVSKLVFEALWNFALYQDNAPIR